MPQIPQKILDSIVYMYPNREAATHGQNFGGTGFLVAVPGDEIGQFFFYVITNWHVALRDGCTFMRVTRHDRSSEIIEIDTEDWIFEPAVYGDVAAAVVTIDTDVCRVAYIHRLTFVDDAYISAKTIGAGEDVFMVGRYVDHDGAQTNLPAVRFGNISVMPTPVSQGPFNHKSPSYILDLHSRTGYSGSPVFFYRPPADDLATLWTGAGALGPFLLKFLGIHVGQFPENWGLANGQVVSGVSGMTFALTSQAIAALLDHPTFIDRRHREADPTLLLGTQSGSLIWM